MKFVRWLGAFGKSASLSEAGRWELGQAEREIAAEPLWKGKSQIDHAKIGLVVDEKTSHFCRGWLTDAWTETQVDGTLRPAYKPKDRQGRTFRDMDRFLAAWNKQRPEYHGEVIFTAAVYSAVVVKTTATSRGQRRARKLADRLNLPLRSIKG